jgi:8-oxo-dGTP diphosphatase
MSGPSGAVDRFRMIAEVHVLFYRDDQVLLLRRAGTGWHDGDYSVVAGHVDGEETLRAAACREAREEAGMDLRPEQLSFVHVVHRRSDSERLSFFFVARDWSGEPVNTEPHKCDDLSFHPLDALPGNMVPYVREALAAIRDGDPYGEWGWD